MTAAAAEYRSNLVPDITLVDAYDREYIEEAADEVMSEGERQALNARMAEWFGIS